MHHDTLGLKYHELNPLSQHDRGNNRRHVTATSQSPMREHVTDVVDNQTMGHRIRSDNQWAGTIVAADFAGSPGPKRAEPAEEYVARGI